MIACLAVLLSLVAKAIFIGIAIDVSIRAGDPAIWLIPFHVSFNQHFTKHCTSGDRNPIEYWVQQGIEK